MAVSAIQLTRWLANQEVVWIDDGGLTIQSDNGSYFELGGQSEEEE